MQTRKPASVLPGPGRRRDERVVARRDLRPALALRGRGPLSEPALEPGPHRGVERTHVAHLGPAILSPAARTDVRSVQLRCPFQQVAEATRQPSSPRRRRFRRAGPRPSRDARRGPAPPRARARRRGSGDRSGRRRCRPRTSSARLIQAFDTVATVCPLAVSVKSCPEKLPLISISSPPATEKFHFGWNGPVKRWCSSAVTPLASVISYVARKRDELAAHARNLGAGEVVDQHQSMNAEDLAVDLEDGLPGLVEDVVVLAEPEEFLANLVAHRVTSSWGSPSLTVRPKSSRAVGKRRPRVATR